MFVRHRTRFHQAVAGTHWGDVVSSTNYIRYKCCIVCADRPSVQKSRLVFFLGVWLLTLLLWVWVFALLLHVFDGLWFNDNIRSLHTPFFCVCSLEFYIRIGHSKKKVLVKLMFTNRYTAAAMVIRDTHKKAPWPRRDETYGRRSFRRFDRSFSRSFVHCFFNIFTSDTHTHVPASTRVRNTS